MAVKDIFCLGGLSLSGNLTVLLVALSVILVIAFVPENIVKLDVLIGKVSYVGNLIVIVSLTVLENGILNDICTYNLLLARYIKLLVTFLKIPL